MPLTGIAGVGQFQLRHPRGQEFLNDFFPVHHDTVSHKRCFCNSHCDVFLYHYRDMSAFGERMKQSRIEAKLTQKSLAAKCGLSQVTISDAERGRNAGSVSASAIAAALGVEPLWLSEGKGPKKRPEEGSPRRELDEEEIQIPPVIAPDEPAPGLYAVENRTIARPPLTRDEQAVLDGYRVAGEQDKKRVKEICVTALFDHGHREGDLQKKHSRPALRLVDTWQGGEWVLYGDGHDENVADVVG